ncbi:hypothetical protein ACFWDI_11335 [Streptomyces sp. NPDC060064]|uniref:hypothetical protein n=1 Tax=Streptomyces sp. NPDC060064 TaxID=3347049 RepID=UPI0036CE2549
MSCSPTTSLTAGPATTRVLVLATFDEAEHVYGALRAGASGFTVKDMTLNDILAAIRVVAAGDALIAPGVMRRLIAGFVQRPVPAAERSRRPVAAVTERKQEALTLVGRGRSNDLSLFAIRTSLVGSAPLPQVLDELGTADQYEACLSSHPGWPRCP